LQPVAISGNADYLVDPYKDDFYRRMIELRHVVKGQREKSKGADYDKLNVEQNALKIATNATSYGIFAEINVNDRAKLAATRIYSANSPSWVWASVWERVSKTIRVSATANDYKKGSGQRVTLDFVTVELADGGVLRL
jgi:hypothetical protein